MSFRANLQESLRFVKQDFVVNAVHELHNFDSPVVLPVPVESQRSELQLSEVSLHPLFKYFFQHFGQVFLFNLHFLRFYLPLGWLRAFVLYLLRETVRLRQEQIVGRH